MHVSTPWDLVRLATPARLAGCACVLVLPLLPATLVAQRATAAVAGTVHDEGGRAVPDVEIRLPRANRVTRTDSAGRFMLAGLPQGTIELSMRRLSYAPVSVTMAIFEDDTVDVDVKLSVVAQTLNALVVQAKPGAAPAVQRRELVEFETRRKAGMGHYITRAQIEEHHPNLLSEMMSTVPGMTFVLGDLGRRQLRFSRTERKNCPPQYVVDGMQMTNFTIDDMPPGDVEGVELYGGAANLPAQFAKFRSTSMCGTVIIWTRVPGN